MLAALGGCSRYIESRDPVRSLPDDVPVPTNLSARVDNASISIRWEVTDTSRVDRFRIYVAESSQASYLLRDSTSSLSFTFSELLISQRYFFKVAAVTKSGLEGDRSTAVSAQMTYLSITVENNRKYSNSRNVTVQINAPTETSHLILSEDSTFGDAVFIPFVGTQTSFTLSPGDGVKTVYCRLQFDDGSITGDLLSDDVILDTRAAIDTVFFAPTGRVLTPGETISFGLKSGEPEGEARVDIPGADDVTLFDDGTNGDLTSGDGMYAGSWVVPVSFTLKDGEVSGSFRDAAGNSAAPRTAPQLLNINSPPQPVELVAVVRKDTVDFTWTESPDEDFASYRLYRDVVATVDTSDVLIAIQTDPRSVTRQYILPDDSTTYYFRVVVFDEHRLTAGSNVVTVNP